MLNTLCTAAFLRIICTGQRKRCRLSFILALRHNGLELYLVVKKKPDVRFLMQESVHVLYMIHALHMPTDMKQTSELL